MRSDTKPVSHAKPCQQHRSLRSVLGEVAWGGLLLVLGIAGWVYGLDLWHLLVGQFFIGDRLPDDWTCAGVLDCFGAGTTGLMSLLLYPGAIAWYYLAIWRTIHYGMTWPDRIYACCVLVFLASAARQAGFLFSGTWLS